MCTCVYIHPVAVATAGGHISGWMNKRPGDPHPQRWRERRREAKSNFICMYIFFRRGGLVCVRKMRGSWRKGRLGGLDSVGEVSSYMKESGGRGGDVVNKEKNERDFSE